jgi:predicted RNase H-like nuclease (RuvC/YqgF family)
MLANCVRVFLAMALVSVVAYAGIVVDRWHGDSVKLKALMPIAMDLRDERDALDDQVQTLTADNVTLKQQISNQNHAVELAQAETNSAKAQQQLAQGYTVKLQQQKDKRIEQLEADLADTTKTLTNLLDNSWRQPR